jgi:hypothetical protein
MIYLSNLFSWNGFATHPMLELAPGIPSFYWVNLPIFGG